MLLAQLSCALPPALTPARHAAMLAERELPVVDVEPGQTATIRLSEQAPNGIWVMHFEPGSVERLDVAARTASGEPLFSMKDVPFDVERGHFYMPCSVHYRDIVEGMPRFTVELSAVDLDGKSPRRLGEYVLDHELTL